MGRVALIVVVVLVLLGLGGGLFLGAFPPGPRTEPVHRVLPNDRFPPR